MEGFYWQAASPGSRSPIEAAQYRIRPWPMADRRADATISRPRREARVLLYSAARHAAMGMLLRRRLDYAMGPFRVPVKNVASVSGRS
jgi:hypothetical protein